MDILGIDIGGSGIKGAPVNIENGKLTADRFRIPTPKPSKPNPVAEAVAQIVRHFEWNGPIGVGFPGVVQQGITLTAANVHKKWINLNAAQLFSETTGCSTSVLNDADAAGVGEMRFGAGKSRTGVVLIITIGTGLGTAVFTDGKLVPNTELGHIDVNGIEAEIWASDAARKREDLSWKKWGTRLNVYLQHMEQLLWPDLIILGGGASKKHKKYMDKLDVLAEVIPARLRNEAGMVGAALSAENLLK